MSTYIHTILMTLQHRVLKIQVDKPNISMPRYQHFKSSHEVDALAYYGGQKAAEHFKKAEHSSSPTHPSSSTSLFNHNCSLAFSDQVSTCSIVFKLPFHLL